MSEESYRLTFVKRLNHYMKKFNKNQMDLMTDLNLSSSTISSWCTGAKLPRMGKIQMLADYFGIEKSDLLEEKDYKYDFLYSSENADLLIEIQQKASEQEFVDKLKKYLNLKDSDKKSVDDMIDYLDSKNKKEAD